MTKPIRSVEYKRKQLIKQNERRRADPEKYKEMGRKSERTRRFKRYGITEEQYTLLWESQAGLCDICRSSLVEGRATHVDHCHTTGQVRGILCHHCNVMLGHCKDNIEILKRAILYLEKEMP